ncbi:MAG: hemolysin family protein [Hyphomicrobium sp.]|nr:hemolysin family protein [Hyphomicrobium sp.]
MFEAFIVAGLIVLNGLFALSELAVVSSRQTRLKSMAAQGRSGARSALDLAADPSRFLSAVQIGITLIGIVNGAYSGEAFGDSAAAFLTSQGVTPAWANWLGYGFVIVVITYLSVIAGELVPKTLALRNPEAIACTVAPAMQLVSTIATPFVSLLDTSTKLVFRLFGQTTESEDRVTEEEIKTLMAEAESAGVIETGERAMISGVMRLADRRVAGLMTPRTDVEWVDVTASDEAIRERLRSTVHSRIPAAEGTVDQMIGVIATREVLASLLSGHELDVKKHVRKAPIVPDTTDALDILTVLRDAEVPMALIHDEYGHFQGLVSPADILEAIAGVFKADAEGEEPMAVERADGSWLIAGSMAADEMADVLGLTLPKPREYQTAAGFVLAALEHLPKTGEVLETMGWRFEVIDLDGRRIDKIMASRLVPIADDDRSG